MFFLNYYLVGYRKNVITQNLINSFPGKSEDEIRKIRKKFYRNFSDYLVETIKSFSISETESRVRMQHINQDLFHEAKRKVKTSFYWLVTSLIGSGSMHWQGLSHKLIAIRFTER